MFKKISHEYKIRFNEVNFTEDDFWNSIPFAAKKIDDPIADYAILPTFKLASVASKKFKVAITGEGGDELFGGYSSFRRMELINKYIQFKKLIPINFFVKRMFTKNNSRLIDLIHSDDLIAST